MAMSMMRKVVVNKTGGPEVLALANSESPSISWRQILVDVQAAGVNIEPFLRMWMGNTSGLLVGEDRDPIASAPSPRSWKDIIMLRIRLKWAVTVRDSTQREGSVLTS